MITRRHQLAITPEHGPGAIARNARRIRAEEPALVNRGWRISVLAITDHNSVRSVPAFQSATPHINVSVEQLEYAPVSLARIRRLAQVLVGGVYPPGETTVERMQAIEA